MTGIATKKRRSDIIQNRNCAVGHGGWGQKSLDWKITHTCCLEKGKGFSGYPCYTNLSVTEDLTRNGVCYGWALRDPLLKLGKCILEWDFNRSKRNAYLYATGDG